MYRIIRYQVFSQLWCSGCGRRRDLQAFHGQTYQYKSRNADHGRSACFLCLDADTMRRLRQADAGASPISSGLLQASPTSSGLPLASPSSSGLPLASPSSSGLPQASPSSSGQARRRPKPSEPQTRVCARCGEVKERGAFSNHSWAKAPKSFRSRCRPCVSREPSGYAWQPPVCGVLCICGLEPCRLQRFAQHEEAQRILEPSIQPSEPSAPQPLAHVQPSEPHGVSQGDLIYPPVPAFHRAASCLPLLRVQLRGTVVRTLNGLDGVFACAPQNVHCMYKSFLFP